MNPLARACPWLGLMALVFVVSACSTTAQAPIDTDFAQTVRADLDMPVAEPPYLEVRSNWKERLEQPYAYVELRGTYTRTARALQDLLAAVRAAGLEPQGAPFALFYDDPGTTSVDELISRACVPIADPGSTESLPSDAGCAVDVLPGATVVYAFVGGPYGDVPRAYPAVLDFAKRLGWKECGPIREIYLVPPGAVTDWSQLVCEVQIPAQPSR